MRNTFLLLAVLLTQALAAGCNPRAAQPPGAASASDAPSATTTPAAAPATPKEVARAFNAATKAGDEEGVLALADVTTDDQRELVRAAVRTTAAIERLRRAVAERFGAAAEYELDFGAPRDEEFDDAEERVTGERALVVMANYKDVKEINESAPGVTRLVRRDERWLVDMSLSDDSDPDGRHALVLSRLYERAAELTIADVKAGKYAEPSDVAGAFTSRPFDEPEAFKDLVPPEMRGAAGGEEGAGGD